MQRQLRFLLSIALFWFSQYVFIPYFTPYLRELGIIGSAAGIILGTYGFSQMVLKTPLGIEANRRGNHMPYMISGFACTIASSAMLFFLTHPVAIFFARLVAGIGSTTWVSFIVYFTSLHDKKETGKTLAAIMIANNSGILFSYIFGIFLFSAFGIRFLFAAAVASACAGFMLFLTIKDRGAGTEGSNVSIRGFKQIISNRSLLLFSTLFALEQVVVFATVMSFTSDFIKTTLDAGGRELAMLSVVFSVACILGSYWMRTELCGRIPAKYQIAACFLLSAVYCVVVPVCYSILLVYLMQVLIGIAQSVLMTLTMSLSLENIPSENRSAAMGLYQSIYSLGMTVGPILMGWLLDAYASYSAAFFTISVVNSAGLILCLALVRQASVRQAAGTPSK